MGGKKEDPQVLFQCVCLTDPKSGSVHANGEAAGCDKLFPTSSPCFCLALLPSLALSWGRKGLRKGGVVHHEPLLPDC